MGDYILVLWVGDEEEERRGGFEYRKERGVNYIFIYLYWLEWMCMIHTFLNLSHHFAS